MLKHFFIFIVSMNFINADVLDLDIIPYEKLVEGDRDYLQIMNTALHEKGIVGVRGIPGYREKYEQFVAVARAFSALPDDVKENYQPNRGIGEWTGYEVGKEKFRRPNGDWVVDDLKVSYYATIPDNAHNRWPTELDLKTSYEELGQIMGQMGKLVMDKVALFENRDGFQIGDDQVGRMLYYKKSDSQDNPYWCGAHFDHGLFTAILPAVYFVNGKQIDEPEEAGLFVRTSNDVPFKKVIANDFDVMMFQVGEFGQLASSDTIRATEHRVHKATGAVERYTMAVFFRGPWNAPLYSQSVLTKDARFGEGDSCTYQQWHEASLKRYEVKK